MITDLIMEFEPQARSKVGEFFGIGKEHLRTQTPIKLTAKNGTGLADENGILFNEQGLIRDLEKRASYGVKYAIPAEYVRGLVFEEVAHYLERKHFGSRKYEKLMPFQQILFGEMFGAFGIALAGVLDKEIDYRKNDNRGLDKKLEYFIDKELTDSQRCLDSYNDLESRLNPIEQIRLRKEKRIVKVSQDLLAKGNLGSYEAWRDFYSAVYPKREVYPGGSYNGLNVAYLYGRLLTENLLRNKEPVQPLLRLSYPQLEQKLTPTLMSVKL